MAKNRHSVVVDPAHGGRDKGVRLTKKFYEKDVTLAIAKLLKKELDRSKNISVLLTRSADRDVSMSDRVKMAKRKNTKLFISLHVNAGFGRSSSGFEVYFPGFKLPSTGKSASKEIPKDMVKTKYLNESVRFAKIVEKNLEKIFRRKDRGLRSAPIPVLEGLTVPAVVLEIGFATNIKDRKKLMDKAVQKSIAGALAKSIREFF
ncbi:MAG: N-acetylmuramoyl-L-alanine amidase [Proteobacteria bacterium]|nr:N-acetylmuramoyl-L-alanine amidase [Pseudomonadota bacterium]